MKKISLLFSSILASSLLMAVPSFADSSQILTESSQSSVESNPTSISDLLIMPRVVNGYWNLDESQGGKAAVWSFTINEVSTVSLLVTQKRTSGTATISLDYSLESMSSGNSLSPRNVKGNTTNHQVSWTKVLPGTYKLYIYMETAETAGGPVTANTTGNIYTTPSN